VIEYALPKESQVSITVYNILGQRVKVLKDEFEKEGYKRVIWDGTDDTGSEVASGIYFYRIKAGDFVTAKKMMMVK
jgi:flagellar hook assembly protein FlgD